MSDPIPPNFPDADATVMIPKPGGKRAPIDPAASPSQPPIQPSSRPYSQTSDEAPQETRQVGTNSLVAAANPLLYLIPQIRATLTHPDPGGLRDYLLHMIGEFEQEARKRGVALESILVARYAICTVIDETVASTPWGGTSQWAKASLLVSLHREAWGGEKFFQLLDKMAEDPQRNVDLLELMYACLALGFEGRFRVIDNGKAQLERLRAKVYLILRQQRGEFERDLSGHWHGVARKPKPLVRQIPFWVVGAAASFILLSTFLTFIILLNQSSDPVFSALASIKAGTGPVQRQAAPLEKPRLRTFLATEIAQGLVDVEEDAQTSRVTLHSDTFFDPGSADPNPGLTPLLVRIGEALNQVSGTVIISGHTDDRPIRTLRFPSNFHLSLQRAQSAMEILATKIKDKGRLKAEGMADSRPISGNDTPAHRASNRRVEILLRVTS